MFRYRFHSPYADDLEEATYAQMTKPGDEVIAGRTLSEAGCAQCRAECP